ncbi:MAG: hypothetical protein U9Q37_08220 [Euryarchaeota archaeon]|nr:hypothetical protein [Euryarchaeota archaeon]
MNASEEVTLSSPLTSAEASIVGSHEAEAPTANASTIAASVGVIRSSPSRSPFCGGVYEYMSG